MIDKNVEYNPVNVDDGFTGSKSTACSCGIADKYAETTLIRIVKAVEIETMMLGICGYSGRRISFCRCIRCS